MRAALGVVLPCAILLAGVTPFQQNLPADELIWDSENMKFTNDPDANRFVHYEYRKGWSL